MNNNIAHGFQIAIMVVTSQGYNNADTYLFITMVLYEVPAYNTFIKSTSTTLGCMCIYWCSASSTIFSDEIQLLVLLKTRRSRLESIAE